MTEIAGVTELVDGDCRICHCTDEQACPGGCWWIPDPFGLGDLCSACVDLAIALEHINGVLAESDHPLDAEELAIRTGIEISTLVGDGFEGVLDALSRGGHLKRTNVGYALPWQAVEVSA